MPSEIQLLILAIFSGLTIYLAYYLVGLLRIQSSKNPIDENEGVSVVVAARNELENLKILLPKLLSQEHPEFEVIIVNDRSSDGSFEFLSDLEDHPLIKLVTVKELPEHVNGKKYALTLGIKAAKNDIIIFTDADCIPASNQWLANMSDGFVDENQIVLGFSPYEKKAGLLNALVQLETHLVAFQFLGSASNGSPFMGVGRNLSYRKSFFLSKKGFAGYSEVTGGDDDIFVNKHAKGNNTAVILSKEAVCWSKPETSWKDYWNQKTRHLSVGKYYTLKDRIVLGVYALLRLLAWPALIISALIELNLVLNLSFFAVNYLLLIFNIAILKQNSGSKISLWTIPLADLIYQLFYILVGIRALFIRKVEWTN